MEENITPSGIENTKRSDIDDEYFACLNKIISMEAANSLNTYIEDTAFMHKFDSIINQENATNNIIQGYKNDENVQKFLNELNNYLSQCKDGNNILLSYLSATNFFDFLLYNYLSINEDINNSVYKKILKNYVENIHKPRKYYTTVFQEFSKLYRSVKTYNNDKEFLIKTEKLLNITNYLYTKNNITNESYLALMAKDHVSLYLPKQDADREEVHIFIKFHEIYYVDKDFKCLETYSFEYLGILNDMKKQEIILYIVVSKVFMRFAVYSIDESNKAKMEMVNSDKENVVHYDDFISKFPEKKEFYKEGFISKNEINVKLFQGIAGRVKEFYIRTRTKNTVDYKKLKKYKTDTMQRKKKLLEINDYIKNDFFYSANNKNNKGYILTVENCYEHNGSNIIFPKLQNINDPATYYFYVETSARVFSSPRKDKYFFDLLAVKALYPLFDMFCSMDLHRRETKRLYDMFVNDIFFKPHLFFRDNSGSEDSRILFAFIKEKNGAEDKENAKRMLVEKLNKTNCNNYNNFLHELTKDENNLCNYLYMKKHFIKTMKQMFYFNGLWADRELFFGAKTSSIKEKLYNFHGKYLQRFLLHPVLDFAQKFPKFSNIKDDSIYETIYTNANDSFNYDFRPKNINNLVNYKLNIDSAIKCFLVRINRSIMGAIEFRGFANDPKKDALESKYFTFISVPDIHSKFNTSDENYDIRNINRTNYANLSIFKTTVQEDEIFLKFDMSMIKLVLKRVYYYKELGIEILDANNKTYYFLFEAYSDYNNFLAKMKKLPCFKELANHGKSIGFYNKNYNLYDYMSSPKDLESIWKANRLLVFDMLSIVNFLSNRSYNDIYQYPVYPLLHFTDKNTNIPRDLRLHVGLNNSTGLGRQRLNLLQTTYEMSLIELANEEIKQGDVCFFNTHYSNPVYTSGFLIRVLPFCYNALELQGSSFDDPNRLFNSIDQCFLNIMSQKSDIRELIPEFFCVPEMFRNRNRINLHTKNAGNVSMPAVSGEEISEYALVEALRSELQNAEFVERWLDLIFGVDQVRFSRKAESSGKNNNNISGIYNSLEKLIRFFPENTYLTPENFAKFTALIDKNERKISESFRTKYEFGVNPVVYFPKSLGAIGRDSESTDNYAENNMTKAKTKDGYIDLFAREMETKAGFKKGEKPSEEILSNNFVTKLKNSVNDSPNFSNVFIKYEASIKAPNNSVSAKLLFTTDLNGVLHLTQTFNHKKSIENTFYDHDSVINSINFSEDLCMFMTTSRDGFINLYTYSNEPKLIRAIKHPKKGKFFSGGFLAYKPFPIIFAFDNESFYSYSINGRVIDEKKIEDLTGTKKTGFTEPKGNFGFFNVIDLLTDVSYCKDYVLLKSTSGFFNKSTGEIKMLYYIFSLPYFVNLGKYFVTRKENSFY